MSSMPLSAAFITPPHLSPPTLAALLLGAALLSLTASCADVPATTPGDAGDSSEIVPLTNDAAHAYDVEPSNETTLDVPNGVDDATTGPPRYRFTLAEVGAVNLELAETLQVDPNGRPYPVHACPAGAMCQVGRLILQDDGGYAWWSVVGDGARAPTVSCDFGRWEEQGDTLTLRSCNGARFEATWETQDNTLFFGPFTFEPRSPAIFAPGATPSRCDTQCTPFFPT